MRPEERAQLEKHVQQFYRGLIQAIEHVPGIFLDRFPHGNCGNASAMIGYYLQSQHGHDIDYCNGRCQNATHAWIECDDVVIDITCGQFEDCPLPQPYVGTDSEWHAKWQPGFGCDGRRTLKEAGYNRPADEWSDTYEEVLRILRMDE